MSYARSSTVLCLPNTYVEGPIYVVYCRHNTMFYIHRTQVASFQINSSSGEITTFRDLDYENETNHVLLVSAADHGDPARSTTVTVTVVVNDVNDNSPIFVSTADSITVNEGVQPGFLYTAVVSHPVR